MNVRATNAVRINTERARPARAGLVVRGRGEDGQLLAMTVVFMTMFLALAGLVVDGGRYFDAKQAAASEAEQAARAGAGSLDVGQLHAGTLSIDPATATTAAESYMTGTGHPGSAWVVGNTVYAQISYRQPTQLLGIIGVSSFQITVTESATDVTGVTTGA
jgi:Flp pilus assembly protein TadG